MNSRLPISRIDELPDILTLPEQQHNKHLGVYILYKDSEAVALSFKIMKKKLEG